MEKETKNVHWKTNVRPPDAIDYVAEALAEVVVVVDVVELVVVVAVVAALDEPEVVVVPVEVPDEVVVVVVPLAVLVTAVQGLGTAVLPPSKPPIRPLPTGFEQSAVMVALLIELRAPARLPPANC